MKIQRQFIVDLYNDFEKKLFYQYFLDAFSGGNGKEQKLIQLFFMFILLKVYVIRL